MKSAPAILLATATAVSASTCPGEDYEESGNWYCGTSGVTQIKYHGLEGSGTYPDVAGMDNAGYCGWGQKSYSGPIAPYDEDMGLFFRGPLNLKSFAVYKPSTGSKKRETTSSSKSHSKRHNHHQHLHKKHQEEKRADMVTAVINGQTQTWENNWFGSSTDAAEAPAPTTTEAAYPTAPATTVTSAPAAPSNGGSDDVPVATGDFGRVAYYDAASQVADGLVFLGNLGDPALSGTWDTVWGNSLSYVSSDALSCAASPEILKDMTLADGKEFAIYSDQECDESCGTVRPDSVAYKGWAGADKAFMFEFSMPYTGGVGDNLDMPAIWALNGKIARTGQYSDCSCWGGASGNPQAGGCGEADIFEVLTSGSNKAKSTFHFKNAAGDSHWFERPGDKTIKVATVFQSSSASVTLKVLDDSFDFSTSLTAEDIQAIVDEESNTRMFASLNFLDF